MKTSKSLIALALVTSVAGASAASLAEARTPVSPKAKKNNSISAEAAAPCKAWGHLIAPGFLKKMGVVPPPKCANIPPGIAKKLGVTPSPTSTADTIAPVISGLVAQSVSSSGATIAWTTNESSTSKVYFGTASPLSTSSATNVGNTALVSGHFVNLTGLSASTTYYYVAESKDAAGNVSLSAQQSFTTAPQADTIAPVISGISLTATGTAATVSWTTNEPATSLVYYGTSSPLQTSSAQFVSSNSLVSNHSLTISGLNATTTYRFIVRSVDSAGNISLSAEQTFTTP